MTKRTKHIILIISTSASVICAISAIISCSEKQDIRIKTTGSDSPVVIADNGGGIIYAPGNENYKDKNSEKPDVVVSGFIKERAAAQIRLNNGEQIKNLNSNSLAFGTDWLPIADDYEQPFFDINFLNRGSYSLDIRDVYVEVLNYWNKNEFEIVMEAGGADPLNIVFFDCEIGNHPGEYPATMVTEDDNEKYVQVKANESGVFYVRMYPSDSGIYEVRVIFEYQYNGETYKAETEIGNFVYIKEQD